MNELLQLGKNGFIGDFKKKYRMKLVFTSVLLLYGKKLEYEFLREKIRILCGGYVTSRAPLSFTVNGCSGL